MYTKEEFIDYCQNVFSTTEGNTVIVPNAGLVLIYDTPLIGFANAEDELFEKYKQYDAIGPNFLTPKEWLPSARTVVSFFLPFSEQIRVSNRKDRVDPSPEWMCGRMEGQVFLERFMAELRRQLQDKGIETCVPIQDERFRKEFEPAEINGITDIHMDSSWSERHAAYVCGLGTFGLSRGLISKRGVAGRYASLIVSEKWQPDARPYSGLYDYCIMCGACVRNCPVQAISMEYGKKNIPCKEHLDRMLKKYYPRYGCGKCQVSVPCEFRAPGILQE